MMMTMMMMMMMMMMMPGNTNTNCPDVLPSFYYLRCRMYSHDRVAFLDEMAENWRSRDVLAVSVIFAAQKAEQTSTWANAQRDGRPAEYRWRPLFNAAKFG